MFLAYLATLRQNGTSADLAVCTIIVIVNRPLCVSVQSFWWQYSVNITEGLSCCVALALMLKTVDVWHIIIYESMYVLIAASACRILRLLPHVLCSDIS